MGSWSIWHWLIVLAVVLLVFGTKRLRNIGSDVGAAIRDFRKSMGDKDDSDNDSQKPSEPLRHEGEATSKTDDKAQSVPRSKRD